MSSNEFDRAFFEFMTAGLPEMMRRRQADEGGSTEQAQSASGSQSPNRTQHRGVPSHPFMHMMSMPIPLSAFRGGGSSFPFPFPSSASSSVQFSVSAEDENGNSIPLPPGFRFGPGPGHGPGPPGVGVPFPFPFPFPSGEDDDEDEEAPQIPPGLSVMLERLSNMEGFLNDMLQRLDPDNATDSSAIRGFKKTILCNNPKVAGKKLTIKQAKIFLDVFNVDTSNFLEKTEFIEALQENASFETPLECFGPDPSHHMCTICAGDMKEGELVTKLPCGHWFHYGHEEKKESTTRERSASVVSSSSSIVDDDEPCQGVIRWLCKNSTCPNCKADLPKRRDAAPKAKEDVVETVEDDREKPEIVAPTSAKRRRSHR